MLAALRRVLRFEMTIAEWIGTAVMLAMPYVFVGLLWSLAQPGAVLESIVLWPALLVSTVCLA